MIRKPWHSLLTMNHPADKLAKSGFGQSFIKACQPPRCPIPGKGHALTQAGTNGNRGYLGQFVREHRTPRTLALHSISTESAVADRP